MEFMCFLGLLCFGLLHGYRAKVPFVNILFRSFFFSRLYGRWRRDMFRWPFFICTSAFCTSSLLLTRLLSHLLAWLC